ncbi:MAG: UvrD-helicase domain-containing protein [Desulfitobacteriaceae bacterium]
MGQTQWTVEQEAAITERGHILVAAAAGSGKTAVLVERLLRRITDLNDPRDIDHFLVVTFTKAAAQEMRERIRQRLEEALFQETGAPQTELLLRQLTRLPQAGITTLHSFCLDLLRRYFYLVGLDPSFRVADEGESELLRQDVLEAVLERNYEREDLAFINLVEGFGSDRDDYPLMVEVLRLYEFALSQADPSAWLSALPEAYFWRDEEALLQSPWGQAVRDSISDRLSMSIVLLHQAEMLTQKPKGPSAYQSILEEDLLQLEKLAKGVRVGNWRELGEGLQNVIFTRLPSIRAKKDVPDEQPGREQVKSLRDEAKKIFTSLKEEFIWELDKQLIGLKETGYLIKSLVKLVQEFREAYTLAKHKRNIVDFNDLEHFTLRLLGDGVNPEIVQSLQGYYTEVLVDEYQDINLVQERILQKVSPSEGNLFMVGDVKQSIYRFRMADPSLFLTKYQAFPHWSREELGKAGTDLVETGQVIDLACNFRSRKGIVSGINFLFRQIMTEGAGEIAYDERAALRYGANYVDSHPELPVADGPIEVHLLQVQKQASRPPSFQQSQEQSVVVETPGLTDRVEAEEFKFDEGGMEDSSGETGEELEATRQEAILVSERIKKMIPGEGGLGEFQVFDPQTKTYRLVQYSDIVILMRAHSTAAPLYVEEFQLAGIPVFAETSNGYFAAGEVETILSLLKIIDNPRQDIPLAAVLRSVLVGLNGSELGKMRTLLPQGDFLEPVALAALAGLETEDFSGLSEGHLSKGQPSGYLEEIESVLQAYRESWSELLEQAQDLPSMLKKKISLFWSRLQSWRDFSGRHSLAELLALIYEETGFLAYCGTLPNGVQRQANLQVLYDRACRFEETHYRGLFRFLRFLDRFRDQGKDMGQARALGEKENVVRIMTVHASKGLEFPVVFVVGLGRTFNLRSLSGKVLIHSRLGTGIPILDIENRVRYPSLISMAVKYQLLQDTLAEELRILYVALTRAKEKLLLYGSLVHLDRSLDRWYHASHWEESAFSDGQLRSAKSFLDWIGPALVRHDSNPFNLEGRAGIYGEDDPSQWEVFFHREVKRMHLARTPRTEGEGNAPEKPEEQVKTRQEGDPIVLTDSLVDYWPEVERRLGWVYPFIGQSGRVAKTSVSELKRQRLENLGVEQSSYLFQSPVRPKFLQEDREITAAERGTALHSAMQHLPWKKWAETLVNDLAIEQSQVQSLVQEYFLSLQEQEILDAKQIASLSVDRLVQFLFSPLGQRMLQAQEVRSEVPFTLALPSEEGGLPQLVQGVIDALLLNEGTGIELIDFKTDHLPEEKGEEILCERYGMQLALYCLAIERLLKVKVDKVTLYSFSLNREIPLDKLWLEKQISGYL